ncbi:MULTISPECIES: CHASE2 domain-containing protein [unclassified Ruegeria]|uniref:CHASE2 domain-containing protein n=1 Tax=unclassified Ruegeria TaxID=2625375 RepID=UPI0014892AC6|nr:MULTISPECIES: adenylate/guanylate cyclase domain-containing protein [unclassified Ruegeria]NOD63796.1 CHASE2 domain-containing protein [Ruegeria sp. HKCCD6109]
MSEKIRRTKNGRWAFRLVGLVLILFGCFIRAVDPYPVRMTRLVYFDVLQRLSPREFDPNLPIRVVDIDEDALANWGQWPWPRTLVAQMVENLGEYGAAAISFDMLFAEPDRYSPSRLLNDPSLVGILTVERHAKRLDNDVLLGMEIAYWPVVLGAAARLSEEGKSVAAKAGIVEFGENPTAGLISVPHWTPIAPPLDRTAAGIGGVNVSPIGGTGIVRRVPVLWDGPDGPMPGLAIESLRVALGESNIFAEGAVDEEGIMLAVEVGGYQVPTTENGELWLKYRRDTPDLYISASDVMKGSSDASLRAEIEGRIILVGTSAAGLFDIHQTALGESVPGVSIHAQMIEQVLTQDMLSRSDVTAAQELLAFVFLGLVVIGVMSSFGAVASFVAGGIAAAAVLTISWMVFQNQSVLFDATFPLIGGMANFGLLAGYLFISTEREKREIRKVFSHYVAPEILDEMEHSGHQLQLGGETQEITVMFSDIRGFTSLSESASATELVSVLNALFSKIGDQVLDERGTIDKFIGDAIMAFWNAPIPVVDHPCRAAFAALKMRGALADFNASGIMKNRQPIALATGIATGQACVGNIGSEKRFNYTVIGDVVNVSARLEQSCRTVDYDIVVSSGVSQAGQADLALLEAGHVDLKGKANPEPVYILVGDQLVRETAAFKDLEASHSELISAITGRHPQSRIEDLCQCCEGLAENIEPGLRRFYRALLGRTADFRSDIPAGELIFTRYNQRLGSE